MEIKLKKITEQDIGKRIDFLLSHQSEQSINDDQAEVEKLVKLHKECLQYYRKVWLDSYTLVKSKQGKITYKGIKYKITPSELICIAQ